MILCGFFIRDVVAMQWKKMENNITFILLMEGCVRQIGFYSEPSARYLNKKATAQSRLYHRLKHTSPGLRVWWLWTALSCFPVSYFCMVLMLLSEMAISGLCTLNIFSNMVACFPFDVTRGPHFWWLWVAVCYFHV